MEEAEIMETGMTLTDWLDDLIVRFLLNLPPAEVAQMHRLCFHVEEAHWFYEDFVRPAQAAMGYPLPQLQLKHFALMLFRQYPPMSGYTDAERMAAYAEFSEYKLRVPVRGAILMDEEMEKLVLVKGWKKGASWGFPRGKINEDEKDLHCAIREVYEETGYDIREAGLVPDNEDSVKHIDIEIHEQNIKLFVFRGVSKETHFEPQTRMEISKIDWFDVRDLPGFKKQKGGAVPTGHTNKFYNVAPFLGQLKRWINEQKRKDVAAAATESAQPVTDHEDAPEEYYEPASQPVPEVQDRSEELRRMMGIGGTVLHAQQPQEVSRPANVPRPPNDLLALLRGESTIRSIPHTPYEQVTAFVDQPETPHQQQQHARNPSLGYQQPWHHFPDISPQRLQQPNTSTSNPQGLPHSNGARNDQQSGSLVYLPTQHVPHQRLNMPFGPGLGPDHHPHIGGPLYLQQQHQPPLHPQQHDQMPPRVHQPAQFDNSTFLAQGSRGPIGGGPPVPRAEDLPMPKMNAHSMQLLDAFKGARKPSTQPSQHNNQIPRQSRQHENALLDLFKKATVTQPEPGPVHEPAIAASDAERPAISQARRPTLNEITRTLPVAKARSPDLALPPQVPVASKPPQPSIQSVQAGKAPDTPAVTGHARMSPEPSRTKAQVPPPPITIMPRPSSTQQSRSPKAKQPSAAGLPTPRSPNPKVRPVQHNGPPKTKSNIKGRENGAPPPAFTILSRSGTAPAAKSPMPALPTTPPRNETSKAAFQPQVLRRPDSVDPKTVQRAAEVVEKTASNADDKRDQLLALFGKPAAATTPVVTEPPSLVPSAVDAPASNGVENDENIILDIPSGREPLDVPVSKAPPARGPKSQPAVHAIVSPGADAPQPNGFKGEKENLSNLFNPPTKPTITVAQQPSAPHLLPEREPSSQNVISASRPTTQNALFDLFNRPSSSGTLKSPGTPISPFTLGTPVTRHAPQQSWSNPAQQAYANATAQASQLQRRESGVSNISASSAGLKGRQESSGGAVTPVEAKGFLLDFLNGVVQKEGHRGGARRI